MPLASPLTSPPINVAVPATPPPTTTDAALLPELALHVLYGAHEGRGGKRLAQEHPGAIDAEGVEPEMQEARLPVDIQPAEAGILLCVQAVPEGTGVEPYGGRRVLCSDEQVAR